MCGIVGYIGDKQAKPILIEGLRALEYRGYDSAGFALYPKKGSDFVLRRQVGMVQNLVDATKNEGIEEVQGIAHTRWATHGVPSEINAHPHRAGHVVLVHNGIIENHTMLKKQLMTQGHKFSSETDTEVFTHLIESHRALVAKTAGKDFEKVSQKEKAEMVLKALSKAMSEVRGHYAILFMIQGLPGYLFGAQCGAPLCVAKAKGSIYVASDLQALLPHTHDIGFLNPGTVFMAQGENFEFFQTPDLKPLTLKFEHIEWSADKVAKGGFEHYMIKEIFEQPDVVADTISGRVPATAETKFIWDNPEGHEALWKNVRKLYLIGCGTAYHSALTAKYFFEKWARLPVEVDIASEFRYRASILEPGTAVGVISQSGETADTLAALRMANEKGVSTFSICNVPGSTIMRDSQYRYPTKAGPEISVASTKAFTAQLTALYALALDVARIRGYTDFGQDSVSALSRLPLDIRFVLQSAERYQKIGASLKEFKTVMLLGRGPMYPIALEGALKIKEITYHHAEGYASGELKHGPLALVDDKLVTIVMAPDDELLPKTLSNLEEIKARKGHIIGIGPSGTKSFASLCHEYIEMPACPWGISPALYVIPVQLLAYGMAKAMGREIDKPRNLAKSVTVE